MSSFLGKEVGSFEAEFYGGGKRDRSGSRGSAHSRKSSRSRSSSPDSRRSHGGDRYKGKRGRGIDVSKELSKIRQDIADLKLVSVSHDQQIRDIKHYIFLTMFIPIKSEEGRFFRELRNHWISKITRGKKGGNELGDPWLYFGMAWISRLTKLFEKLGEDKFKEIDGASLINKWIKAHRNCTTRDHFKESLEHFEIHEKAPKGKDLREMIRNQKKGGDKDDKKDKEKKKEKDDKKDKDGKDKKKIKKEEEDDVNPEGRMLVTFTATKTMEQLWAPVLVYYTKHVLAVEGGEVSEKQAPLPKVRKWKEEANRARSSRE